MGFVVSCLAVLLAVAPAPSAQSLDVPPSITVPSGFQILAVAQVPSARELVALPNGDLIVGTESRDVYLGAERRGWFGGGAARVRDVTGGSRRPGSRSPPRRA